MFQFSYRLLINIAASIAAAAFAALGYSDRAAQFMIAGYEEWVSPTSVRAVAALLSAALLIFIAAPWLLSLRKRETWAERDQLELAAIACLSVGKSADEPYDTEPQLSRHRALKDAVRSGALKTVDLQGEKPNVHTLVSRADLRTFAAASNNRDLLRLIQKWDRLNPSKVDVRPSPDREALPQPSRKDEAAAYNAALKLPIVDEAIGILNHNAIFEQPIDDAGRVFDSIIPELKAGRRDDLLVRLDDLRQRFVANNQRIGALYVKTESIHEDIAAILVQPYSTALYEGIHDLKSALAKIENPPPANVDYWIKPQLEKFKTGIGGVGAWRGTALFALFDLRRKLIA